MLPLSNQLLSLGFKSGHSRVWEPSQCWISVLVAVLPLVWEVARLSASGFRSGCKFGQVSEAGGYPGQAVGE